MQNAKRFFIPGGGSFDVALDDDTGASVVNGAPGVPSSGWVAPVLIGGVAGAGLVALLLWTRNR